MGAVVLHCLGLLLLHCNPAVAPMPLPRGLSVVLPCLLILGSNAPIGGRASATCGTAGIHGLSAAEYPAPGSMEWRGPGSMALCSEIPQDVQESNSRPRDFWQFGERPLLGTEEHVRFDHRVPQLQHSMRHGHRSRSDGAIPSREGAQTLTTRFHRGRPQGRACPAWFCQHVGCLRVAGYVFSQPQSSDPFFCKPRLDFTYTHMYTGMYIYVYLCMCIRMKKRCMRMHIQMNITTATRPYILILFEYLFIYPLVYSWYNSRSLLPLHYVSFRSLLPLQCTCDAEDVSLHMRRCDMCTSMLSCGSGVLSPKRSSCRQIHLLSSSTLGG